jgi:hypothetical protein
VRGGVDAAAAAAVGATIHGTGTRLPLPALARRGSRRLGTTRRPLWQYSKHLVRARALSGEVRARPAVHRPQGGWNAGRGLLVVGAEKQRSSRLAAAGEQGKWWRKQQSVWRRDCEKDEGDRV